ncbi:hypothetical protein M569_16824 [Genlisea aurea]|uniref:Antitoxin VbhA domain-containing protein n=1 Tax=Genlisea aurea TaxID=192259 RepID=S8D5V2_9LAMI|nr:hypothetical protein M569_16824 [Genlisea aurea]
MKAQRRVSAHCPKSSDTGWRPWERPPPKGCRLFRRHRKKISGLSTKNVDKRRDKGCPLARLKLLGERPKKRQRVGNVFDEGTMKPTEQELATRYAALENAVASHRLEGLEPDTQTIEDLQCVVRGEFDIEESLRRVKERIASGEFQINMKNTSGNDSVNVALPTGYTAHAEQPL